MTTKHTIPTASLLYEAAQRGAHYADSYTAVLPRTDIRIEQVVKAFFQSTPNWVDWLFALRNQLVKILGLKTGLENSRNIDPPYSAGRQIGLFRIIQVTPNEIILGEDDKHLDFRVSLMINPVSASSTEVSTNTIVTTKNASGRLYLFCVLPFHRLIAQNMHKRMSVLLSQH